MDLAVIIVTWNVRDLVLAALRSLLDDLAGWGARVIVVDNASSDGTPDAVREAFPQVEVIASDENLGFAAGNNLAMRRLMTDGLPRAVYLLNPDTETRSGATRILHDALFDLPRAGLVGARLYYGDGSHQDSAFAFPGIIQSLIDTWPVPARLHISRLNGRYPRALYEGGRPFPVDHTLGATMMLRGDVIEDVGIFDEGFFMYCEEIDWSMRIRASGREIYCIPAAEVIHYQGQSTRQIRTRSVLNLWRSRIRLFEKHYSPLKVALLRGVIRVGMRHQIARARADDSLTPEQRAALIAAYEEVMAL